MFLDMSYLIPMFNVVEVERDAKGFGKWASAAGFNPAANPVISTAYAAFKGEDPFTGQENNGRFTQRQLGFTPDSETGRSALGLIEHVARTMAPPLIPPGYAGTNLLELLRKQNHPRTGAPLEQGLYRTLSTNLIGMRIAESDINSAMLTVGQQEAQFSESTAYWWDAWQWARANGDPDLQEKAEGNLRILNEQRGSDPEEVEKYMAKGMKEHEPGTFRTQPKKKLEKARDMATAGGLTLEDETDQKQLRAINERIEDKGGRRFGRENGGRAFGRRFGRE